MGNMLCYINSTSTLSAVPNRFPLSISSNGRYLIDVNGVPFPILGDSPWFVYLNLSITDQKTYFDDRVNKGFNTILAPAIDHKGTINKPPLDFNNNLPFTKRLDGTAYTGSPNGTTSVNGNANQYAADNYTNINNEAPNFTWTNSTYWTNLKNFISMCQSRGFLVFLFPAYIGFDAGDEGYMLEMVANDAITGVGGQIGQPFSNASKTLMWNYGAFIADAFKSFNNIIWLNGGDYGDGSFPSGHVFTTQQKAAVNNVMAGIKSVAGTGSTLHTAHWSRGSVASDVTLSIGSFDLESVYTGTTPSLTTLTGSTHAPTQPIFAIECIYEDASAGSAPYRKYNWWTVALGGGYLYGNDNTTPLWSFQTGWQNLLNSQGGQDAGRINSFINSIPWWRLIANTTVITANGNTTADQTYISAASDSLGKICIAYIPPAWASTTFTVDMTVMSGTTRARWFNPFDGTYTAISTSLSNTGTHIFTPPGNNGSGSSDWVLIMDTLATVTFNWCVA